MTKQLCWQNKTINMLTSNQYYWNTFLSVRKAHKFLRQMRNTTESGCDCLPDCDLMDLQYSVTTTNLMWVLPWIPPSSIGQYSNRYLFRKCDSRNLNLNPLCMLKKGSLPALWTERVIEDHFLKRIFFNSHWRWKRLTKPMRAHSPPTSQPCPTRWGEGTRTSCLSPSQR